MTELYEKRNRSDLEYRLVILCCLKELGIVTMEQLWPFIARLNLMEYMQMCVFLRQLQQDGYAAEGAGSIQGALYITDTGINLLQVLSDKIPHSDRTKIQSEAPAYLGLLREALTARAVYHTGPDNAYTAKCAITDGDLPAFICIVSSPDKEYIDQVVHQFKTMAHFITLRLISLCSLDSPMAENAFPSTSTNSEESLKQAYPEHPRLYRAGPNDYAGAVCLVAGDTEMRFLLQIGSYDNTLRWIWAMEHAENELKFSLKALLAGNPS